MAQFHNKNKRMTQEIAPRENAQLDLNNAQVALPTPFNSPTDDLDNKMPLSTFAPHQQQPSPPQMSSELKQFHSKIYKRIFNIENDIRKHTQMCKTLDANICVLAQLIKKLHNNSELMRIVHTAPSSTLTLTSPPLQSVDPSSQHNDDQGQTESEEPSPGGNDTNADSLTQPT